MRVDQGSFACLVWSKFGCFYSSYIFLTQSKALPSIDKSENTVRYTREHTRAHTRAHVTYTRSFAQKRHVDRAGLCCSKVTCSQHEILQNQTLQLFDLIRYIGESTHACLVSHPMPYKPCVPFASRYLSYTQSP